MRSDAILDISECTEFRQALEARPPRVVHGTAVVLAALVGMVLLWAALARADLVVRTTGRVRPLETPQRVFNPVRGEVLSASTGGRVVEVNFREGDAVEKGQVLIRFDAERLDTEIAGRRQKIRAGENELKKLAHLDELLSLQLETARSKAKADLAQAEEEVQRAKERQTREVGLAKTELEAARDEEERLQRLVPRGGATAFELAQATARRRGAEQKLEKARVPVEEGRVEVLRQALVMVEKDHAVKREEHALQRTVKQAEVDLAKSELANLELERQQAVLRAPQDGVVTAGQVRVGDLLESGKPVLEIAGGNGFRMEALVSSEEVGHLQVGMRARIKLDAFDYQKYGTLEGTVSYISPDSGMVSGSESSGVVYLVKIDLASDEVGRGPVRGRVKLGMAGQVEIVTGQETLLWLLLKQVRRTISLG